MSRRTKKPAAMAFLALTAAGLCLGLTGCRADAVLNRDWAGDVTQYVENAFQRDIPTDINAGGLDGDAHVFYVTVGENPALAFEVRCESYYSREFFAYVERDRITDDFLEVLTDYASEKYGICNISGMSLDDILEYVDSTMTSAEELYAGYHTGTALVPIRYVFFNSENAVIWECNYSKQTRKPALESALREAFGDDFVRLQEL